MPRSTSYYGFERGAIVVEKRKGTVSSVKLGTVDRNPPEGAYWTLLFRKTTEITDKQTVREIVERLRVARFTMNPPIDEYDRIVAAFDPSLGGAIKLDPAA